MAAALAIAVALAACGNDATTVTDRSSSASVAPEEQRAPAGDVAAGLHQIDGIVGQVADATASRPADASGLVDRIEPVWSTIEGTVKANDPDAYLSFEDAFAALEQAVSSGDVGKARSVADDVSNAVTSYLASYPG
jgi:hypothetical protein